MPINNKNRWFLINSPLLDGAALLRQKTKTGKLLPLLDGAALLRQNNIPYHLNIMVSGISARCRSDGHSMRPVAINRSSWLMVAGGGPWGSCDFRQGGMFRGQTTV